MVNKINGHSCLLYTTPVVYLEVLGFKSWETCHDFFCSKEMNMHWFEMWQEQIKSILNVIDRQNIYSMEHTAILCWVEDKWLRGKLL